MSSTLARAAAVWCLIVPVAVANGALRVMVIIPLAGEPVGHIASTILLCALIAGIATARSRWIGAAGRRAQLAAGGLWLVLTVAFEFLAGHYLFGNSWERLLADYNVADGRIWILVPAATFLAPLVGAKLRGEPG